MPKKSFLSLLPISLCCTTASLMAAPKISEERPVLFYDVSSLVGLVTSPETKYGGPTIADINNDGRYDLILFNHNQTPIEYYQANTDGTFTQQSDIFRLADSHSTAPADFDRDGDLDILLSLGGGSGAKPKPPRMLRNDGDEGFTDVTLPSGISELGARGRSVRWLDMDLDGNLDCVAINEAQTVRPDWPRNLIYRNNGDGTFKYIKNQLFENLEAEKSIISDFDGDLRPDIFAFSEWHQLTVLRGLPNMELEDATDTVLPEALRDLHNVNAVAHADIDGDGDLDYYLARGGSLYNQATHCCERHRLDFYFKLWEDQKHSLTFEAQHSIQLLDFFVLDRGTRMHDGMPIFAGAEKTKINPPGPMLKYLRANEAAGFPETMDKTGWYIGYLGREQWKLSYHMEALDLAWSGSGSILGVDSFTPDWQMIDPNLPDILLRNDGGVFTDISHTLPEQAGHNSRGVTPGDFNNDGLEDFMVFRYGELSERTPDLILLNRGVAGFEAITNHGATQLSNTTNGDMGIAFDYDLDGDLDLISGDEMGAWKLFSNQAVEEAYTSHNYLLIRLNLSKTGFDPVGAKLKLTTESGTQIRVVGSGGAAFSQSLLNTVHFGLATDTQVKSLSVVWRDGSEQILTDIEANQYIQIGKETP